MVPSFQTEKYYYIYNSIPSLSEDLEFGLIFLKTFKFLIH